jgi:2-oxo-3-hexenedioate decarboxylase
MSPRGDIAAFAREMKSAQDAARPIERFTARLPDFDLVAAYEVAAHVHRARRAEGATPVGRKIGFTNRDMWARYGVRKPIWGWMYDRTVVQLESTQANCSLGAFVEPKIEPEIVLHLRTAPPLAAGLAEIAEAIDWVAHGYEIVQSHFPSWDFAAPDTVADGALHGMLFVGPRVPLAGLAPDPIAALETFALTLSRDGELVETGAGRNVLGSPLVALAHLVGVLAGQPGSEPLAAGEIVTTGTITLARAVQPGETWTTSLRGVSLPGLRIGFSV